MGLFNFFKKKNVPDELPDLAINELKKDKDFLEEKGEIKDFKNLGEESKGDKKQEEEKSEQREEVRDGKEGKKVIEILEEKEVEDDFFDKLVEDIDKELTDLNKFDKWIENYWEKQKGKLIMGSVAATFRDRINQKSSLIKKLEREWQNLYFELVDKEEEIKEQEQELKKLLNEFAKICKRRGNLKKER